LRSLTAGWRDTVSTLKGALLGVGHVAIGGHLPGWRRRPDAEIVAAADGRSDRRGALLEIFPQARWYETAEDLLAEETLDFVDICTPPASHAGLSRLALERSLHVLCEKPLVLSPEELRGLPVLAAEKHRTLFTVHNWKHAPILQSVTGLVRAGAIGQVRRVRWETLRDKPAVAAGEQGNWRVDPAQSGGGILIDHGWHALYVLSEWMTGAPRLVAARLESRKHHAWAIEDTATVTLAYPSATVEIFLTWAAAERANRIELEGTRGLLRLDGGRLSLGTGMTAPEQEWSLPSLAEGSHHPDWFDGVISGFLGEIADPRKRGQNLGEATLCANVLALARDSSRRGGAPISVERIADSGRR
jgi:predicted dehydrogenase